MQSRSRVSHCWPKRSERALHYRCLQPMRHCRRRRASLVGSPLMKKRYFTSTYTLSVTSTFKTLLTQTSTGTSPRLSPHNPTTSHNPRPPNPQTPTHLRPHAAHHRVSPLHHHPRHHAQSLYHLPLQQERHCWRGQHLPYFHAVVAYILDDHGGGGDGGVECLCGCLEGKGASARW